MIPKKLFLKPLPPYKISKVGLSAERETFGVKTKKSLELRLHSFSLAAC